MLPMKGYVVEAYYKWIVDSGYTPYLVVDATVDYVEVPEGHIEDGQIILNMAPQAIRDPVFHRSYISFRAQFSGATYSIYIPILSVISIYAKENGEGKMFDAEDDDYNHPAMKPMPRSHFADGGDDGSNGGGSSGKTTPFLRVIK